LVHHLPIKGEKSFKSFANMMIPNMSNESNQQNKSIQIEKSTMG
jgi:hypothetical protein